MEADSQGNWASTRERPKLPPNRFVRRTKSNFATDSMMSKGDNTMSVSETTIQTGNSSVKPTDVRDGRRTTYFSAT